MSKYLTLTLILMVVNVFKNGETIKCYVCRTDKDSECEKEPINKVYVKTCPKRPGYVTSGGYCRKIVQQLYFKEETWPTIIRECAYEKNSKPCYKSKWPTESFQEICECSEDECNDASNISPWTSSLYFAVVAYLV